MKIPFCKPNIQEINNEYLRDSLNPESGLVEELENRVANYIGSKYAVAVTNGFSAFHLSLSALNLKRGDKIMIPINSHPSIAEAIRHFDAEPICIDADENSFNMDLDLFEETLKNNSSKKLKGAVISSIAGQPVDLERVYKLAKEYKIFILEDGSHGLGGIYDGEKIGSLYGDLTVFSFSPLESPLSSNGAVITTNDEDIYKRAVLLRDNGIVRENDDDIYYIYDVVDIGFDYKMSKINAAYCLSEFDILDKTLKRRKEIAKQYRDLLKDMTNIILPVEEREHSYYSFIIKIDKNRDGFARKLATEGIQTGLQYTPIHMLTYYKNKYELKITSFPKGLKNYQQMLSIPIYSSLTDEDIYHITDSIKKIVAGKYW
ncbi:MAG: DegT/DnrJ/EryC1/StrS aminotransferase family protein [Campylobacterales bacterium]|nr:DegT/DnrJ/EryC1/StrS aminotransferase family protein [Campylobacterales bacterium]